MKHNPAFPSAASSLHEPIGTIAARALVWINGRRNLVASVNHATPLTVPSSGCSWYVLACIDDAYAKLKGEDLGFPVYRPMEIRRRVMRRNIYIAHKPLIPGYVFVRFDRSLHDWRALENIREGCGVLVNNQIPMRVPDALVERIQMAEDAGVFDCRRASAFQPGDEVEILYGPFAGFIAKVKSASPHKRTRLFLQALGEVEIDIALLRKVSAPRANVVP